MNNEKHGNEYLAMIQEQNPNFNPEETLAMLNVLTAMTKTYEDHQKAEAQNQTTLDSANANTAESAETPTIGQFASQDEINLNENEGQDATTRRNDGSRRRRRTGAGKTEITLDDDFKLYLTQNGISLEQYLAEPSKYEDIKKSLTNPKTKRRRKRAFRRREKQQNEENEAAARAKEKEDAAKAAAEEEAQKRLRRLPKRKPNQQKKPVKLLRRLKPRKKHVKRLRKRPKPQKKMREPNRKKTIRS